MAIWTVLLGAATGVALGGPLGALIGGVIGAAAGRRIKPAQDRRTRAGVTFTIAVIALAAKMARADGAVVEAEWRAFERLFQVPTTERANVYRFYQLAQGSTAGFEAYASQVGALFADDPAMREDVLDALFVIAKADGAIRPSELDFLQATARALNLDDLAFHRLQAAHLALPEDSPWAILGLTPGASAEAIRAAWLALIKEHHPDRLTGKGVPLEFVRAAQARVAAINVAYETLNGRRREASS
jgi:DnaJ like chaperone protein